MAKTPPVTAGFLFQVCGQSYFSDAMSMTKR